jgi:hypothetical protein
MVDIRLKVWAAIVLDAAEQFFDLTELLNENAIVCGCKYNHSICRHDASSSPQSQEHLYTRGLSIIYGGYSNRSVELVDQMCHCDILDSGDYSTSDNPKLDQLCRPVVLIVPLTSSPRELYFMDSQMRKKKILVEKNDALTFGGDTPHGGVTYAGDRSNADLKPAVHLIFHSIHHDTSEEKNDTIKVFPQEIVQNDPSFLKYLNVEQQLDGVKYHMDAAVSAVCGCSRKKNKHGNQVLKQYIEECTDKLSRWANGKRK